jgi:hypothetical protein
LVLKLFAEVWVLTCLAHSRDMVIAGLDSPAFAASPIAVRRLHLLTAPTVLAIQLRYPF